MEKIDHKKNVKLVKTIIKNVEENMSDEELIHMVLDNKMSAISKRDNDFGSRAADVFAGFAGSWTFVIGFSVMLIAWIIINGIMLIHPFDEYPFILLNLVLSCIAAIQAPLIMMSQNRQEQKDRERSENDYKVNLKTEIIIEDIHRKLDQIILKQKELEKKLDVND